MATLLSIAPTTSLLADLTSRSTNNPAVAGSRG